MKPINPVRFKTHRNNGSTATKPVTMGVKMIKRKMTMVGSMAWMAPEMMKGELITEVVVVVVVVVVVIKRRRINSICH